MSCSLAHFGHRLPFRRAIFRPQPIAITNAFHHRFNGNHDHKIIKRAAWGAQAHPTNVNDRLYSSTPITCSEHRPHPKSDHQRHKLHIGFTSLSNSLPFESSSSENSASQMVGDTELDPHATIMLTSLRGGVLNFDCPAPPSIEGNKRLLCSATSTTCWIANRQSELQICRAFDQAWMALLEEDDGEALRILQPEMEGDDGDDGGSSNITMTCRLGYRSSVVLSEEDIKDAKDSSTETDVDCHEREGIFDGDARVGVLYAGKAAEKDNDDTVLVAGQPAVVLVHNLSEEYVLHSLRSSPLVRQYKQQQQQAVAKKGNNGVKNMKLISLAHNPETQIAAYLLSNHQQEDDDGSKTLLERARDHMKQSLTSAFVGYEIAVKEGMIDGYGVDSNGLSLPESHDMHFGWRDVLECAVDAYLEVHGKDDNAIIGRSSLKVIRLPGNVLEMRGVEIANEICSFFGTCHNNNSDGGEGVCSTSEEGLPSFTENQNDVDVQQKQKLRKMRNVLPKSVEVYVTRPLTAYPYGGTGWGPNSSPGLAENSGAPPLFLQQQGSNNVSSSDSDGKNIDATHPIRFLDYQIETGSVPGQEPALIWSNEHYHQYGHRPAAYQPILNAVLSHFDAEAILEASRDRELTMEERETLDGCKLLQGMLHDLDASLDTMKSFAAYEEYLMNVAVPLIYGSFEELDEESAGMIQLFFRVHGMAVRMVVARWTRDLLLAGWKRVEPSGGDGDDAVKTKDKHQEKEIAKVWKDLGFGDFAGGYDIAEDVTLQEFALKQMLKDDAVQGLVIGCSRPEHVLEAMRTADSSDLDEEQKDC